MNTFCARPWTHLYLMADCAYTCPLMGQESTKDVRIRSAKDWSYYTNIEAMKMSDAFVTMRGRMWEGGLELCCGSCNCGDFDRTMRLETELDDDGHMLFRSVAVSVTDFCRGNCTMCFQESEERNAVFVPQRVMDDLTENVRTKAIFLMGGEIFHLSASKIERYLSWASTVGDRIGVTTAGDGRLGDFLESQAWEEIRFSIDSCTEMNHASIRPGIDRKLTMQNLARALQVVGPERIVVLVTAMTLNSNELDLLLDILVKMGVRRVRFNVAFPGGRAGRELLLEGNETALRMIARTLPYSIKLAQEQGVEVQWPKLQTIIAPYSSMTQPS